MKYDVFVTKDKIILLNDLSKIKYYQLARKIWHRLVGLNLNEIGFEQFLQLLTVPGYRLDNIIREFRDRPMFFLKFADESTAESFTYLIDYSFNILDPRDNSLIFAGELQHE